MKYDFDKLVDKTGLGNMKYIYTPEVIKNAGAISYAGAEMDFKTAPAIIDALFRTAQNGLYGFTLCDDTYTNAVISWMKEMRCWEVKREWILPTHGTIFSLSTAIRAFTDEGDIVIVQNPVYSRYKQAMDRNKRRTAVNPLIYENGKYSMDFNGLEKLMAMEGAKMLVLCNPHNPVGRVWNKEELTNVAVLAKKYDVLVFSDEIFAEIAFNNNTAVPYSEIEGACNNCIVSTSLGKVFNFTGVNHANMIIPNERIRERFKAQRDADHYGSIDPFAYSSVIAAYNNGAEWVREMVDYVWQNIVLIREFFREHIPDVKIAEPQGGFIIWIDWSGLGISDEKLYDFLRNEAFLELDPGSHYGVEGVGFSRMNVASPRREIEKSLALLLKAAEKHGFAK